MVAGAPVDALLFGADGTDGLAALLAHPRLSAALANFVSAEHHRLIVLPGIRDSALASF